MALDSQNTDSPANNSALGLERILFFSDAVMAIAMTLLAIDLKIPEIPAALAAAEFPRALTALSPKIISFVISFVVVGIYWAAHHRYFGYIKRYDPLLIALNMLFLLFIAVMPFAASLLGQYPFLPQVVAIYSAEVAAIGFSIAAVWLYASSRHRLVAESLSDEYIHTRDLAALIGPSLFSVSIFVALYNTYLAILVWWISPFVSLSIQHFSERRNKVKYIRTTSKD